MYWFRDASSVAPLLLLLLLGLIGCGGWLTARSFFRLHTRERWFTGFAIGISEYVFLANIFGRFLSAEVTFWVSAILVLAIGVLAAVRTRTAVEADLGRETVTQFVIFLALVGVIALIGRGLGIFDDRKNLSIISTMAAGDIPPHFYMNSDFNFGYHYGFQLFAAGLMRIGGLFPWSAFDLGKAIVGALAIMLVFLFGWRVSARKARGVLLAAWVTFASGARWMLLFLPPSILGRAGSQLQLWGSGAESAPGFMQSLIASWVIEGGPPVPMPFAFVNGIMQPFILYAQAGPKSLALVIFLLLLLLIRRGAQRGASAIIVMLLATWALAAEAEFILFGLGLAAAALTMRFWQTDRAWRVDLRKLLLVSLLALIVSLLQGGTLTELVRGLLTQDAAQPLLDAESGLPFMLRIPPAVVSSHLGEMHLTTPGELLIALFELGPILILSFLVLSRTRRWQDHGQFFLAAIVYASLFGFVLPLFLRYQVDRDITRMTNFALYSWLLLGWMIWESIRRRSKALWFNRGMTTVVVLSSFAGFVVLGSLMTAIPEPVFADEIDPIDAAMTRDLWDVLPMDSLVLDSSPWRAVTVTGRSTRSSADSYNTLASWEKLVAFPKVKDVVAQGFDLVYIDRYWWDSMPEQARGSYLDPCVNLLDERFDNGANGARWLYDLSGCSK